MDKVERAREAIARIIDPERYAIYEFSKANGDTLFDISDLFAKADAIIAALEPLAERGREAIADYAITATIELITKATGTVYVINHEARQTIVEKAAALREPSNV